MKSHKLNIKQVERRLAPWHDIFKAQGVTKSWAKLIRKTLGISTYYLAKKMNISQPNIVALEQRELKGSITLNTLESIATAMNCKLVYAFVPLEPIDKILETRARKIAKDRLTRVTHSMSLEDQNLTDQELKEQYEELVQDLLNENPKNLWKIEYD